MVRDVFEWVGCGGGEARCDVVNRHRKISLKAIASRVNSPSFWPSSRSGVPDKMSRSKPSKQTSLQQDRTEIEPLLSTSNAAVVPPALEEPAIVSASVESPDYKLPHDLSPSTSPLHALPIAFRPSNRQPHRWTFPILFVSGMIAIISVQAVYCLLFYPPRVVGTLVRWKAAVRWADKGLDGGREWTKVLFGQLREQRLVTPATTLHPLMLMPFSRF